jgi:hypothetical protein
MVLENPAAGTIIPSGGNLAVAAPTTPGQSVPAPPRIPLRIERISLGTELTAWKH